MATNDLGVDPNINPWTGLPYDQSAAPSNSAGPAPDGWTLNPDGSWTGPDGQFHAGPTWGGPVIPAPTSAPAPTPTTTAPPSSGGGGYNPPTSGPFAPIQQDPFNAPIPQGIGTAPTFNPTPWKTPPAFSYGDFQAPTYQQAADDPGYKFAVGQGEDALRRGYAASGIGDSGTAYKGLIDYGQSAGATQYQNVWNRDLGGYQTNRANAVDNYNTNYKTQYVDPWTAANAGALVNNQNAMQGWQTNAQNTQFNNATSNTNSWNQYLADYLRIHNNQLDSWGRLMDVNRLQ